MPDMGNFDNLGHIYLVIFPYLAVIPALAAQMYGLSPPKKVWVMGYRRVWVMLKISRIPTREMENTMGYKGVWVIRAMDYEGVDCNRDR
jgi:hypothetical protein